MTPTPQSQGVSGMTTLPTTPTREEGCVITTLPPLICSIGGTPYNEDHLAWKDKKISTLTTENARLAERVRVLEGALLFATAQLEHDAPGSCWATGPHTGDPIQDYVVCPGCAAIARARSALLTTQEAGGMSLHSSPFSSAGHDLYALRDEIRKKADQHEIYSLRSDVDRLERTNREISASLDGVRAELQRLQEDFLELQRRVQLIEGPLP